MEQIATFLDMGGYAFFVWMSYGVAAAIMIGLLVSARAALKSNRRILASLEGGEQPEDPGARTASAKPAANEVPT